MYILSFIKNWFSKKEKPKEKEKHVPVTQVILFDCVGDLDVVTDTQEPFEAEDDIYAIDWFGETYMHVYIN